jgi:hypothetical protein
MQTLRFRAPLILILLKLAILALCLATAPWLIGPPAPDA